jgi:hypothetical protein
MISAVQIKRRRIDITVNIIFAANIRDGGHIFIFIICFTHLVALTAIAIVKNALEYILVNSIMLTKTT